MLEWLKKNRRGEQPAQAAAPQAENGGDRREAASPEKKTAEPESRVMQSEYGLMLDWLYIGCDGHLELAFFECNMTPPSMFESTFDLTFRPHLMIEFFSPYTQ